MSGEGIVRDKSTCFSLFFIIIISHAYLNTLATILLNVFVIVHRLRLVSGLLITFQVGWFKILLESIFVTIFYQVYRNEHLDLYSGFVEMSSKKVISNLQMLSCWYYVKKI